MDNPRFFFDSIALSFAAMFGQMMLYYTIHKFGALVYATIMTTRQTISITLSCIVYFHPLSVYQIIGAAIVFLAVYLKSWFRNLPKKQNEADVTKL